MSGAGKTSVSSRITENNSDHGSFVGIFITLGGLLLIAFGVVVHRDVKVKKMRSELSNGDNRSRTVAVYRYMLKYLKLIGIADSRNITDLQLCDRLTEKCQEMQINDFPHMIKYIGELAVKAEMSNSVISDGELETALSYFEIVKDKIVLPKLSGAKLLNAKFVYCLY